MYPPISKPAYAGNTTAVFHRTHMLQCTCQLLNNVNVLWPDNSEVIPMCKPVDERHFSFTRTCFNIFQTEEKFRYLLYLVNGTSFFAHVYFHWLLISWQNIYYLVHPTSQHLVLGLNSQDWNHCLQQNTEIYDKK